MGWLNVMSSVAYFVTFLIPVMSGVFLFTALYKIRKDILRNHYRINIKAMTLHATSFGLFMASILIYLCAYVM
jgi:hypothetical protein